MKQTGTFENVRWRLSTAERRRERRPWLYGSDSHQRREAWMASLKYRVRDGWRWEVFTDDGQTAASGTEPNQSTARAAAILGGIRAMSSGDNPPALWPWPCDSLTLSAMSRYPARSILLALFGSCHQVSGAPRA
jgi:hypothetical protein